VPVAHGLEAEPELVEDERVGRVEADRAPVGLGGLARASLRREQFADLESLTEEARGDRAELIAKRENRQQYESYLNSRLGELRSQASLAEDRKFAAAFKTVLAFETKHEETFSESPFDEELRTPPARTGSGQSSDVGPQGSNGTNGNGRITNKQIKAIFAIGRQKGMTNEEIRSHSRQIFQRNVDYLAKHEASRLIESLLDL